MDADVLELKRQLYMMPEQFGFAHSRIWEMRTKLRLLLFKQLTGEHAHILFGSNDSLETRCLLKPEDWLDRSSLSKADKEALDNHGHSHHGRPCGRKLERGEPTHRCLTCGLDDTCVLCKYCFNPSDHVGHNVFVKISCRDDGGICDCGDSEAWTREIHCFCDQGPEKSVALPVELKNRMRKILDVMLDYTVDVLSGCSLEFQTNRTEHVILQRTQRAALVAEKYGFNPAPLHRLNDKWCLQVWDDDKRSVTDMRAALLLSTERNAGFINMITERIQKVGKATVAVADTVPPLMAMRRRIKHFVTTIRSTEDVMREEMVAEIIEIITELCRARIPNVDASEMLNLVGEALLTRWEPGVVPNDLPLRGTELRLLTPQYRSEMDWYSVPWDASMQRLKGEDMPGLPSDRPANLGMDANFGEGNAGNANFGNVGPDTPLGGPLGPTVGSAPTFDDPLENEELFGPEYAYGHLSQQLQNDLSVAVPDSLPNWPIETSQLRLKLMLFFDVRLHKSIRHKLTDLYVAVLLSNHSLKTRAAVIYADVYPLLVDQYIHLDKDPDLSVTTALSTQLFTTPSIATMLMETDAFGIYLNLMRRVFTKRMALDPKVFRNRRLGQIFHEFGYLLWRNSRKETVGANPWRIGQAAQFLALFQGLAPMRRRADKHIEYENEKWVYCYASMPYALTLARSIAAGIEGAPAEMQMDAFTMGVLPIAQSLIQWQTAVANKFDAQSMEIKLCYGKFKNIIVYSRGINVGSDPISLLNPVHAFLSWLIEFSSIPNVEVLRKTLKLSENNKSHELFEASMCTLAVVAHISVGYWVRNGYAMRIQLQSYRDATLRDLAYARDIYMTQVALSLLDPNTVLMNLIRHFGLINWPVSTFGDTQQAFYLLDEFVHTLNTLLTDRLRFQGLRGAEMKRAILAREVIQVLGFKSMPYSELTRMIPESLVVDEQFDTVLADLAVYAPPRGAHGVGLYSLKSEYYSQFDPFYTHYTISKCEEAEKEAEAKMGANHMGPLLPLQEPWTGLDRFTRSPAFAQLIIRILVKLRALVREKPDNTTQHAQAEASFNRILYLLIMSAQSDIMAKGSGSHHDNCFETFSELVKSEPNLGNLNEGESLLTLLYQVHESEEFPNVHVRIETLIELLHRKDPEVKLAFKNPQEIHERTALAREEHKQRGKEVQRRVLAEMARQQQQFMKSAGSDLNSGLSDDDDDNDDIMGDDSSEGYIFSKHCVLCQMPDDQNSIFGILTYTSQLRILRELPTDSAEWIEKAYSESCSLDTEHAPSQAVTDTFYDENGTVRNSVPYHDKNHHTKNGENGDLRNQCPWGPAFPREHVRSSTLVQGCGHGVHQNCLNEFLRVQQQRRSLTRVTPDHHRDGEFLCPLCKGLNNCFMPVLWNTSDLEASEFLADPENTAEDMTAAIAGTKEPQPIDNLIESSMSTLNPKFLRAIKRHDFSDVFHINVRNALLEQMLRIKKKSKNTEDFDKTYGLRTVYRSFADSISQLEVALRGKTYSTPFGGLVMDQLPTRVVQFLRVFAKYINTLTGFILSSFSQVGKEPEKYRDLNLAPDDTFTKTIEMFYMGGIVSGVSPKTVLRQVVATEVGRVISAAQNVNTVDFMAMFSKEGFEHLHVDNLDPRILNFLRSCSNQDPRVTYTMLRYHMTVVLRRHALVIFAICGKYDPDDFVGMMNLPEHDRLSIYLGLPQLNEILLNVGNPATAEGVAFLSYFGPNRSEPLPAVFSHLSYPGMYRLISLPVRLDMMFNVPGQKVDPAVCLMCGEMFSIQASTISTSVGPCNDHVATCGLSQGVFLLARLNVVLLLLPPDRGTFTSAPYLDLHGEPDENMRRGRPHYLQAARYDALMRDVWLSNGLPSLIARKLDQSQDTGGWETL